MRLAGSLFPHPSSPLPRAPLRAWVLLCATVSAFALAFPCVGWAQRVPEDSQREPARTTTPNQAPEHGTAEWANLAEHLPDKATASGERLETAADVLRARRYTTDALEYYNLAMAHGADPSRVLKKMGITDLEMQQPRLARLLFQQSVHRNKRDGIAWNDLAAADLALGETHAALSEYRRAVKLEKNNAVFHANLALAYFEVHSPSNARRELDKATQLDPDVLHRTENSGYSAQVLSAEHYAEVCFAMAHLYAQQGDAPAMLEWLGKASERGLNLRDRMAQDAVLAPWLSDPRVGVLVQNAAVFNARNSNPASSLKRGTAAVPSLGAAPQ